MCHWYSGSVIWFTCLLLRSFSIGFVVKSESLGDRKIAELECLLFRSSAGSSTGSAEDARSFRLDKRLTGSSIIDDALQDILQYILRDYIENWYGNITNDVEFLFDVRQSIQQITVNISNRLLPKYLILLAWCDVLIKTTHHLAGVKKLIGCRSLRRGWSTAQLPT